jgi:hypothetical protein
LNLYVSQSGTFRWTAVSRPAGAEQSGTLFSTLGALGRCETT